jgi:predicted house-cleaning noncanonical NTP pyrophosphatase (MazG superfamily)
MTFLTKRRLVKLVRDRVGPHLADGRASYEPIDDPEDAVRHLRRKLVEEAVEYALEPSVEELADVIETVRALARRDLGVTLGDVLDAGDRKRAELGGYGDMVGMYVTVYDGDPPAS